MTVYCELAKTIDPAAQALGCFHNVADVDVIGYPRGATVDGKRTNCRNRVLFQARGDEQWAGCRIFPGNQVNAAGWCTVWAPKI